MQQESEMEKKVTDCRITLVDSRGVEYEFIILDEIDYQEQKYLALVPCDEKTDMGSETDPGEANDIVVVREEIRDGEKSLAAVTDSEELYGVARIIDQRYGHLCEE